MSEALNNLEKVILDRKKQFAESGLSSDEIKKPSFDLFNTCNRSIVPLLLVVLIKMQ